MKPQPKKTILEFLKSVYPEWRSGAVLEDYSWGGKKSCTGRALRRLYTEGRLEREYRPLEHRHDEQVFYRFKPETTPISQNLASGGVIAGVDFSKNISQLNLL